MSLGISGGARAVRGGRQAALGAGQSAACCESAATLSTSMSGSAAHRYMDVQKWAEAAAEAGAVVFLAVHEQCVEDGGLQEALTNIGVPHTGTSGEAALAAYDKVWPACTCPACKGCCRRHRWLRRAVSSMSGLDVMLSSDQVLPGALSVLNWRQLAGEANGCGFAPRGSVWPRCAVGL